MTVGEMLKWTKRLEDILAGPKENRCIRLGNLLQDLEKAYGIPAQSALEKQNPYVVRLYRTVSEYLD